MSRNYSQKDLRLLYTKSGNLCAFPGCNCELVQPPVGGDPAVNLSDIAHIVGDSRQGPRGRGSLTDEQRNTYTNLILLCVQHHRMIDTQPHTFSVEVLRQMKLDHERRVSSLRSSPDETPVAIVEETLHSTMLSVTHLPRKIYSAPCRWQDDFDQVRLTMNYPEGGRDQLFPFVLRDGRLYTFQDLKLEGNAFEESVNYLQATSTPLLDFIGDSEGQRRVKDLLNQGLRKYLGRFRIWWDRHHRRYYFPANEDGTARTVEYRPLNAKHQERNVAWAPIQKKSGLARNYWWHLAAGLSFQQVANKQWHLTIRPERHMTRDGRQPFPPEKIGARVTSLKARMYNDKYLAEVQFWRDVLCRGHSRFTLNFTDQSLVCESKLVTCPIAWPGVPDDQLAFRNEQYDEDLFSLSEFVRATSGDDEDGDLDEEMDDEYTA